MDVQSKLRRLATVTSTSVTVITLGISNALAYPFQPDPQSFAKYLNQLKWSDGSKNYFQNLNVCEHRDNGQTFMCHDGYVTNTSPLGKLTCRLWSVDYSSETGRVNYMRREYRSNCRRH